MLKRVARGVTVVLAMVGGLVLAIGLAAYAGSGRSPGIPSHAILDLAVSGDPPEVVAADFGPLMGGRRALAVHDYIAMLGRAKTDPRIAGVLLRPRGMSSPYWAKVQELRAAAVDFRESGKPLVAFLEYGGERDYYLATAASRIWLVPSATLELTGVATYEVFLRGALDWLGTYPDFLHVGDYKTAVNAYTERTFTPAHKEMSSALNADLYRQLVQAVADGRGRSEEDVRALVDRGPFTAHDAESAGLVDALAYDDQLDDLDEWPAGVTRVSAADYAAAAPAPTSATAKIAVIHATGAIVSGTSAYNPVDGALVGSDTLAEQIREARGLPGLRAIVLRIDSPGGSSVASDVIWRELTITKQAAPERPLIVSMSDLAASGGYYLAMAGDAIVANPATLTGSIGIFGGKYVTGGTLDKVGVNIEATSQGAHAEIYSPDRPFSDAERSQLQAGMQVFYDQFVERVARARGRTPAEIHRIAQGRVWTGQQALAIGLVDELGGLTRAIALAKSKAGLAPDADVEVLSYPRPRSLLELLNDQFGGAPTTHARLELPGWLALVSERDRRTLTAALAPLRLFRPGETLALMPFAFAR